MESQTVLEACEKVFQLDAQAVDQRNDTHRDKKRDHAVLNRSCGGRIVYEAA